MKVDLTATNEKTLYVVFDTKRLKVLLETESLEEARSFVNYNATPITLNTNRTHTQKTKKI